MKFDRRLDNNGAVTARQISKRNTLSWTTNLAASWLCKILRQDDIETASKPQHNPILVKSII